MRQKSDYEKAIQYESVVGNAFGVPFSSNQRPEITDAYRTFLSMKGGIKHKGNNLEKQFSVLRKYLVEAVAKFQKRNTDETKTEQLETIRQAALHADTEDQIVSVLQELNDIMPIE